MTTAYITRTDLQNAINADCLEGVSTTVQDSCCVRACGMIDGYLQSKYTLPLQSWSDDLKTVAVDIAAFYVMRYRGYNPNGGDVVYETAYRNAVDWLRDVSRGAIVIGTVVDANNVDDMIPAVISGRANVTVINGVAVGDGGFGRGI